MPTGRFREATHEPSSVLPEHDFLAVESSCISPNYGQDVRYRIGEAIHTCSGVWDHHNSRASVEWKFTVIEVVAIASYENALLAPTARENVFIRVAAQFQVIRRKCIPTKFSKYFGKLPDVVID